MGGGGVDAREVGREGIFYARGGVASERTVASA